MRQIATYKRDEARVVIDSSCSGHERQFIARGYSIIDLSELDNLINQLTIIKKEVNENKKTGV